LQARIRRERSPKGEMQGKPKNAGPEKFNRYTLQPEEIPISSA
jgi:hypothetical protein